VLYAVLRTAHTVLAFLLFATFIAPFSAALMHALIYRDGVFPSMASWKSLAGKSEDMTAPTIKRNAAK
jgi:cytochrome b561